MKKKTQKKNEPELKLRNVQLLSKNPILHITLKSLFVVVVLAVSLFYVDDKGYFNPDESNNHTKKKWDSFYEFTEDHNVDVLLLGNSHLYSGINPINLSNSLGANAFILASPGTSIADTYFALKEALIETDPKLVVIETFGINDFNPYELDGSGLSDQLKSFYYRKNVLTKLASTPFLFKSDNYAYAWSNTIRNHHFLFTDTLQISKNIAAIGKRSSKDDKLYLGRFVRFLNGLENDVLVKYDTLGAPVNGADYSYSDYAEEYVRKIAELCKEKNIELMFLTIPMYYKHVTNYSDWNEQLSKVLMKNSTNWLNMQVPYDTVRFSPICFENTYNANQHLTYNGSLIATYKLVEFIQTEVSVQLPNRKEESEWQSLFYGEEGYFENNPVREDDPLNQLVCENFASNNVVLKEVSILNSEENENAIVVAKIKKGEEDLRKCTLRLIVHFLQGEQLKSAAIDLRYDFLHEQADQYVFKALIQRTVIKELKEAGIYCPK